MIHLIDVLDGFKAIESNSIDIVLIDPPYNIGKDFGVSKDNMSMADYLLWSDRWIGEAIRTLQDSGTLYIYGFPEILAHISVRMPLEHKWLVWHYTNKTVPTAKFWQRSHESILCCWKDTNKRIFNRDDVREEYTDVFLKNAAGKSRKCTPGRYSHSDKETTYVAHAKGALPRDVIKEDDVIKVSALAGGAGMAERWFLCKQCNDVFKNDCIDEHKHDLLGAACPCGGGTYQETSIMDDINGTLSCTACKDWKYRRPKDNIIKHPTQKPYKLTERLLLAAKPKEGGRVVIPFVGSGAECAVAEDLGLDYTGFEINPDYVKLATLFLSKRKQ